MLTATWSPSHLNLTVGFGHLWGKQVHFIRNDVASSSVAPNTLELGTLPAQNHLKFCGNSLLHICGISLSVIASSHSMLSNHHAPGTGTQQEMGQSQSLPFPSFSRNHPSPRGSFESTKPHTHSRTFHELMSSLKLGASDGQNKRCKDVSLYAAWQLRLPCLWTT